MKAKQHENYQDLIIGIRDRLRTISDARALSVIEQNILRDCEIALGLTLVRSEIRCEARDRVVDYWAKGLVS